MLEFDKERFAQFLREAPVKEPMLPKPTYSPYIQTLIDAVKDKDVLDLSSIDWQAIDLNNVTPVGYGDVFEHVSNRWIESFAIKTRRTPSFQLKDRVFF